MNRTFQSSSDSLWQPFRLRAVFGRACSRPVRTMLAACCALVFASSALATSLVRMTLAQLAQASAVIVRGTVVSQATRWNAPHTRIYTFTTVAVNEAIKGHPTSSIVIQQPGGTIGDLHVFVPGTMVFHPSGNYILFLEPGPEGRYLPVGMAQGAYPVYRGKRGVAHVALPFGALALGEQNQMIAKAPTLGQFHAAVAGVLSAPITIPRGTLIPVVVDRTNFRGVGRFAVVGHTTMDLFPGPGVVIPAGSRMEGLAQTVGQRWEIFWDELSIRGHKVRLHASSELPASAHLPGRSMVARVR